jgi:hypothetical protein
VVVLGIVLIVLGVAFIVLGLAAAAREVFRRATAPETRGLAIDPEAWEKLLRAITELVKVAPSGSFSRSSAPHSVGIGGALL